MIKKEIHSHAYICGLLIKKHFGIESFNRKSILDKNGESDTICLLVKWIGQSSQKVEPIL